MAVGIGFQFEAGYIAVRDAAGHNPLKITQISSDIHCKAMRGDPLRDMNPNRSNLLLAATAASHGPDAGQFADSLRHHAKDAAGPDQHLFEQTNVVDRAQMWAFFAGE